MAIQTVRATDSILGPGARALVLLLLALAFSPHPAMAEGEAGYVGSTACEGCHTYIYENWKTTRHASSVMTGAEARSARYPLPVARRGGRIPTIRSWDDVSYVIGRRKRIAYVDRDGDVQDTGYHTRMASWGPFPATKMQACGGCHFTGFGSGPEHDDDPAISGRWVEMSIACEACHGPGGRHVESLNKEDITVDASGRVCGGCHTTAGRVLPVDDRQEMHDVVQAWNHDRHVTGVQFQSHNAFCARCHSPFQGRFVASTERTERRVFTEHKQNITCIGCHNPHELTNELYAEPLISLQPAVVTRLHTYQGDDGDFTTTDFVEFETIEGECTQCHRGADRVDLDHANATCIDCHNSYKRNRTPESRIFHDANRPELSCQPCHRDADHLLTIVLRDPEFLQPAYIHNLRKLPAAATAKYGLRFTGLSYPRGDGRSASTSDDYQEGAAPILRAASSHAADAQAVPPERQRRLAEAVGVLLEGRDHRRLAADEDLRAWQDELRRAPGQIASYLALADAYAGVGEREAAREMVAHVLRADAPRTFLTLPLDEEFRVSRLGALADREPDALARALLGADADPGPTAVGLTLRAYLQMTRGRFEEAATALEQAQTLEPDDTAIALYRGLAELGRQRYEKALEHFDAVLLAQPDHVSARLASGWTQLERHRFVLAKQALQSVIAAEPENPVANYLLGRGYRRQGDVERAAKALAAAVTSDPGFIEAWFELARTYRDGGRLAAAIRIHQEIVKRQPDRFEARFELASLLKLAGDSTAFLLESEREKAVPPATSTGEWKRYLVTLERSASNYAELALSEFALALRLRPSDIGSVHQVSEIHRRSGRFVQALGHFDWLARREPDEWLHLYRLGTVLMEMGRFDVAIAQLARAIELAPAEGDTYFALGVAYVRAGRLDDAIETFRQGTVYEAFNPALHMNLGAARARAGQYALAREALDRSLELASFPLPRQHLIHTNLALVHLAEGHRDEAVKSLKTALHVFPGYEHARALLAGLTSSDPERSIGRPAADAFVFNDYLERFGEVTTVAFDNE